MASPLTSTQFFVPSPDLMISCGCVAVDLARRKVIILRDTDNNTTQLPKGRKNIGETHHAAALRETYEETGIPFAALPVRVATRAVPSADMLASLGPGAGPNPDGVDIMGISDRFVSCEPSAVCLYRCADTRATKMVFWFAAQGDSTAEPRDDTKDPWEDHLRAEWVELEEAAGMMTTEADAQVVEKVLADIRQTGYDI